MRTRGRLADIASRYEKDRLLTDDHRVLAVSDAGRAAKDDCSEIRFDWIRQPVSGQPMVERALAHRSSEPGKQLLRQIWTRGA